MIDQDELAWIGSYGLTRASGKQGVDDDTLFEAASVSKVVTALTVLRLVDTGIIDLDAPPRPVPQELASNVGSIWLQSRSVGC